VQAEEAIAATEEELKRLQAELDALQRGPEEQLHDRRARERRVWTPPKKQVRDDALRELEMPQCSLLGS
jgi:hypothetical protein